MTITASSRHVLISAPFRMALATQITPFQEISHSFQANGSRTLMFSIIYTLLRAPRKLQPLLIQQPARSLAKTPGVGGRRFRYVLSERQAKGRAHR
jgi:hypothetical protein